MITSSPTSSAFRRTVAHVLVAAAALMATMFALASPVAADEDPNGADATTEPTSEPTSDSTSEPTPSEQPTSEPAPSEQPSSEPAPATSPDAPQPSSSDPEEPGATEPDPSEPASTEALAAEATTASDPEMAARQADLAAVEPDFGYTKFRVGVQIADGSTVPSGTTTLGSEITIVETGPNVPGGTKNTTCTTTAFLDPGNPTASFCQNLNEPGPFADAYLAMLGSIITITQTSVNANLIIIDGTKTDEATCDELPICLFNGGDILLTDAVRRGRDDDDSDDDESDDHDKTSRSTRHAALPDTGGEDPLLLAYGAALLAGGGSLLTLGRRRRAYEPWH